MPRLPLSIFRFNSCFLALFYILFFASSTVGGGWVVLDLNSNKSFIFIRETCAPASTLSNLLDWSLCRFERIFFVTFAFRAFSIDLLALARSYIAIYHSAYSRRAGRAFLDYNNICEPINWAFTDTLSVVIDFFGRQQPRISHGKWFSFPFASRNTYNRSHQLRNVANGEQPKTGPNQMSF